MSRGAKRVLTDALRLPVGLRAAIAGRLLQSLDDDTDPAAEAAWAKEIDRRIRDMESGKVKGIPWSVARRMIRGSQNARPKA